MLREFSIKISSLPEHWEELICRCHMEGIDPEELMGEVDENNAFPIPWDGCLSVDGNDIVLDGSAQPCGPPGCGQTTTRFPKDHADTFLSYSIRVDGRTKAKRFRAILEKNNVEFEEF